MGQFRWQRYYFCKDCLTFFSYFLKYFLCIEINYEYPIKYIILASYVKNLISSLICNSYDDSIIHFPKMNKSQKIKFLNLFPIIPTSDKLSNINLNFYLIKNENSTTPHKSNHLYNTIPIHNSTGYLC